MNTDNRFDFDFEAAILDDQLDADGEGNISDGSDKVRGVRCITCNYVLFTGALGSDDNGVPYPCNCRPAK